MTTFVALGDSITLGVGDPVRIAGRRAWRGWAALLAEGLREPSLHVLASCGAQATDVERDQLPAALQLRPDIASVIVGVNDTLRAGFDPVQLAAASAHTVGALRAAGAEVLTMRLPDPATGSACPARWPGRRLMAGRSTTCWPPRACRPGHARTPSRPARRPAAWPRSAGWPPRAPPGCCDARPTWCQACWPWR